MFDALDFLDLSQNEFTGILPSSVFDIPVIRLIYLNNNRFEGGIPSNFANAASLRDLYLGTNLLTGEIPSIMPGQLVNLNEFLVHENSLRGEMPASICSLIVPAGELEDLWADCAEVNGAIEVQCTCCTQCSDFPPFS